MAKHGVPTKKKHTYVGGRSVVVAVVALALVIGGVALALSLIKRPAQADTGSPLVMQGSMSDEEAQALVNEMTEASRITVSVAPEMVLAADGALRVNLVVPDSNNGLAERIEIEQDGQVVYSSGTVEPGYCLEWGSASTAHLGPATATVYAIKNGSDFGSPISVEVLVVEE